MWWKSAQYFLWNPANQHQWQHNLVTGGLQSDYLSVQAECNRLVPQCHEEISSVHLILQVSHHSVNWNTENHQCDIIGLSDRWWAGLADSPRSVSPLSTALLRANWLLFIFRSRGTCSPDRASKSNSWHRNKKPWENIHSRVHTSDNHIHTCMLHIHTCYIAMLHGERQRVTDRWSYLDGELGTPTLISFSCDVWVRNTRWVSHLHTHGSGYSLVW